MSSRQLAENGDIHCWYAEMQQWFESQGMSINALPPFQYSLDCPHPIWPKWKRIEWSELIFINLENKITWISPKISLGTKMAHFLHTLEDGFIIGPPYMDIHLSYALLHMIRQRQTSSHQLEIEVGRYTRIPLRERIRQLCHRGVEMFVTVVSFMRSKGDTTTFFSPITPTNATSQSIKAYTNGLPTRT